jgi:hypothetical protein
LDPAVIEDFTEALQAYSYAPTSEPKLTNPMEVQDAIPDLKFGKVPGPNSLPDRALNHLPERTISLPVALFNAVFLAQYCLPVWKHSRVIFILKPGKDPSLPSSYRPVSLLNTIGKLFGKIILSRILIEVSKRGLLRNEHFEFRSKPSTTL